MYRNIAVVTLLLLAPAMVAAQNISLDIVEGAYPGPYDNSATFNNIGEFGPGSQLTLWTVINTDTNLDGIEYKLHVNDDVDNAKFDLVGYAVGPLSGFGAIFDGLGDAFNLLGGGPPLGWATGDYSKQTLPVNLAAVPKSEAIFNNTALVGAANINGDTVVGYIIQANNLFTEGTYEFSALGSIGAAPTAEWTSTPAAGQITTGNSFILTVVPEPSSALLLLAAVPFLRRRRA